jgi:hypothetical protein
MSEIEVYMGIKEIRFKHNNRNKRTPCENIIDAIDKSSFLREETKNSFINFVKHVEEIESNISSSEVLKDLKDKWSEEGGIRSGVIYFVMEDDHVVIEKMIGKQDNLFLLKLWNDYVKRMEALRKELRIVGEGRVKIAEDIMKHCTPAKKTDCETRKVNPSYGVKCHKCKQIFPISRTKFKKYNRVIRCRFCNKENKYVQNDLKTL